MPSWIEFHDSEFLSATRTDTDVSILLDAYIHRWEDGGAVRTGTGWMQQLRLVVGKGVGTIPAIAGPVSVVDGKLAIADVVHPGLVRMPIESKGPVSLCIQLGTGETLEISGESVELEWVGEARYVEELAADLWPGLAE